MIQPRRIIVALATVVVTAVACHAQDPRPPLRVAWLSDTHVGSPTGSEDLRESIRDINTLPALDFVLVTGDITELGRDDELTEARADFDSLRSPLLLIPGNHDTKWSASGFTSFARLMGNERFVAVYDSIVLIGMHEGPLMRMGDGHFAPEDLRWLDSVAAAPAIRGKAIVFCTHYPVDSSIDNWYEVTDRLRRLPTVAILCGHGHRNGTFTCEGIPAIMDRSNLRNGSSGSGYAVVEVSPAVLSVREKRPGSPLGTPWVMIPVLAAPRPSSGIRWQRPSYALNDRYPSVRTQWIAERKWTITGGACIEESTVVVGDRSGTITGYSLADGAVRWVDSMGGPIWSTPAGAGGRVVVVAANGDIVCIESRNGNVVWKDETGVPLVGAPCIKNDLVLIGSSAGRFYAFSLGSGKRIWEQRGIDGFVETRPLVDGGAVYFGAWDTYFYALNLVDGSIRWKWSNGSPGRLLSPAACWPVASGGRVFLVAPDRYMTALDEATGNTVWRSNSHVVRESMGMSEDGSRIYARSMRDTIFAFSPTAAGQETVWQTVCGYGYDIDPSMCIEKGGTVFFGTKNGLVFAIRASDGSIRWVRKIGETIVNTPAPLDGRRVVVTDFDGRVVLLEGPE